MQLVLHKSLFKVIFLNELAENAYKKVWGKPRIEAPFEWSWLAVNGQYKELKERLLGRESAGDILSQQLRIYGK